MATNSDRNLPYAPPAPPGDIAQFFKPVRQISTEADPTGKSLHTPGAKADAGKLRPTLILRDMANAILAVTKIATDGAIKYTPGGWIVVPEAEQRYEDAHLRHMLKRFSGERIDSDSQSLHLAHEAWNALAKLELHLRNNKT